jgi:hypothetical protein
MARTFGAAPILPHDLGTSPILEAVLQLLVLLNGTRKDLAAIQGLVPPEGAALDRLLGSAEGRVHQLRALNPPPGMRGLFDGMLPLLEIWKSSLDAIRAGDLSRAKALAGDVGRKADGFAYLFQINLSPRSGALRTSTKRHSYLN